jgi:hypothetical protein
MKNKVRAFSLLVTIVLCIMLFRRVSWQFHELIVIQAGPNLNPNITTGPS